MQVAIDIGSTRTKLGFFEEGQLRETHICTHDDEVSALLPTKDKTAMVFSSVRLDKQDPLQEQIRAASAVEVSATLQGLPLRIAYQSPETLGADRIAAAAGACRLFPQQDCLVVDLGTCVTYTLVQGTGQGHGLLLGGAISPGLRLRLKSLAWGNASLPTIAPHPKAALLGRSTEAAIQAGSWYGIRAEVQGLIQAYASNYKALTVVLCGGDAYHLDIKANIPIFVREHLVLVGLQYILQTHYAHVLEEKNV